MTWNEVVKTAKYKWVVIEVVKATSENGKRIVDECLRREYAYSNYDIDNIVVDPVKVIKGKNSNFLRLDYIHPDGDEDDIYSIFID